MTITNKLFSLLGFAEPMTLKRLTSCNLNPEKTLLLSLSAHSNKAIEEAIKKFTQSIITDASHHDERSFDSLVIDATQYINTSNYHDVFTKVQHSLKYLAPNARFLMITNVQSSQYNAEKNAFSQAMIGFTKSLAKEIGRKGSTANVILLDEALHEDKNINDTLDSPIHFFLSPSSTFVSGQVVSINSHLPTPVMHSKSKKLVALVTGAAQGIGAQIASTLTQKGYLVIGVDIEPMKAQLNQTMSALDGESFILDVASDSAGEHLTALANQHNGFDLIVHNAGITRDKTLAKMPEHFWQQTISINLLSVMAINKSLLEQNAINTGGRIVCLSSMNGIAGQGGQTNYACSKAGIIAYVSSMVNELSEKSITINAVAPGFIETKMTEQIPFFTREMGRRMNALGQGGLPIDVAETIAFLGKPENYTVSGQTIRVCGLNIMGA